MLHSTLKHYEVVSAVTTCPPAMLFVSRSIVFKTSMEAWMHKSKPRGIHSKIEGIFVTIGEDVAKIDHSKPAGLQMLMYANLKDWTTKTMASFDEYISQFKEHQTQLLAIPDLLVSTPAMMDYATIDRFHSEKLVRWVDVQIAFLKRTIEDVQCYDVTGRSAGWIMGWAREVIEDMTRIRRYIHEYRQEIRLFESAS